MPTILRAGPYRIYFFSHEPNEPAHVHVDRDACSAKFWIRPVSLARSIGFASKELGAVFRLVSANQEAFGKAWDGYFGAGSR